MTWEVVGSTGREVVIEGKETNEFLRLLGVEPLGFRSAFRFDPGGSIVGQRHDVDWGGVDLEAAMAPVVSWAEEHEPEELGRAYPDGRMAYSEETGRSWLRLLLQWHASSTSGDS